MDYRIVREEGRYYITYYNAGRQHLLTCSNIPHKLKWFKTEREAGKFVEGLKRREEVI